MKTITDISGVQAPIRRTRKIIRRRLNKEHRSHSVTSGRTRVNKNGTQIASTPLPPYDINARVVAEEGLFDHMEFSAKHGYVIGDCEEIDLFRSYLGAAPQEYKSDNASGRYGRLFKVAPMNGQGCLPLDIRKRKSVWRGKQQPAPPLTGKLKTYRRQTVEEQFICNIQSELHLNPSRGVNLCPLLTDAKNPVWKIEHPDWVNAILTQRAEGELARGLDGNDNVIPIELLEPARKHGMERYLAAVYTALITELRAASRLSNRLGMESELKMEDLSLRRVETYWEFSAPSAVAQVKNLVPLLRAYHRRNREREHGRQFETIENAPSITLFLSAGEQIRVYAKTADRIRFEVVHSPKKQNGLLPGGYRATTFEDFWRKLECLRRKAANRVNQLLAFLTERAEETPQERASGSGYASRWFQCIGHSEASVGLLEWLRVNGRIVKNRGLSTAENILVRRAKDRGLIFYHEDARAYFPANLGNTLPLPGNRLQELDNPASVAGHKNETQPARLRPGIPTAIKGGRESNRIPPSPPRPQPSQRVGVLAFLGVG